MSEVEARDLAAEQQAAAAAAADGSADAGADANAGADGGAAADDEDAEIEAMRARVAEMEEEARRMSELSGAGGGSGGAGAGGAAAGSVGGGAPSSPSLGGLAGPASLGIGRSFLTPEQSSEQDSRSIHVSQVDYSVTEEELRQLFEACGSVNRATILKDKFTGAPRGYAYIEFASADSIANAMILNETEFKGRTLKITPKRTNVPGYSRGGRGGGRGRGGYRGGYQGGGGGGGYAADPSGGAGGYGPIRGRGRGRGRGGFHPYHQQQQY